MSLLSLLREKIPPLHPFLLFYHKLVAVAAAVWFGFPGSRIKVIAITGTKGKSTTCHLLASILKNAGFKVGMATTIDFRIGEKIWTNDTKQTTQGRFRLQKLLYEMVRARCDVAILEVTSHALMQSRLWGVNVDTAVLTNIQRDHLEYHGGLENYVRAKGLLFNLLAKSPCKNALPKTAVLPADDPQTAYFKTFPVERKILFGAGGALMASDVQSRADGSRFTLKAPGGAVIVDFKLPGAFNIQNALAAAGAALSLNVTLLAIQKGLQAPMHIPGRLEALSAGQPFDVIVDYAHTPVSLEEVLSHFRSCTKGRLIVVFGATGGGRDKAKRAEMGRVADRYADFIMVTDDDPYIEDRMTIINQVAAGIAGPEGEKFWKILGRKEAIQKAFSLAREGDTVIIAGKGCEPIQIIGEERIPWDDRKVAMEILAKVTTSS